MPTRARTIAVAGFAALALTLGGAACSDDDNDGNPEVEAPDVETPDIDAPDVDVEGGDMPDVDVNESDDGDG